METGTLSAKLIKAEALRLGFSACGTAQAEAVNETISSAFCHWLSQGMQSGMNYMSNYKDKRLDPRLLMDGTRSIISVALNYYPSRFLKEDQYQFAWYAYGKDYHDVMKVKLSALQEYISSLTTLPLQSRIFCDTAPVLERYWAWKAGLGWIGKNTQLIIPHAGSCFFLGEIFIDHKIDLYDQPQQNRCGNCNRCLIACPTRALEAPYLLNSENCLSYLTIEYRNPIPSAKARKMGNRVYGCDECLKACPWNRFSIPCQTPEFQPSEAFLEMQKEDWELLTEEQYRILFKGSAVKRAKYSGLIQNIKDAKDFTI